MLLALQILQTISGMIESLFACLKCHRTLTIHPSILLHCFVDTLQMWLTSFKTWRNYVVKSLWR